MLAPPRDPSVAVATMRKTLNLPPALRLPERGRITSEGIGGKTASRAINRATPAYPTEAITFVAQVTSCATSSAMQGYYTTGKVMCRGRHAWLHCCITTALVVGEPGRHGGLPLH